MSAATSIRLTPNHKKTIHEVLEEVFPSHILSRGAALMRERAVRSLRWVENDLVLEAKVQGSKLYTTTLTFEDNDVMCACSCPYDGDCKHAVAVLLELRKHAGVVISSGTLGLLDEASPAPAPTTQPSSIPLIALIETKLGKKLLKTPIRFLEAVAPWWLQKRSAVNTGELCQACGRSPFWSYREVALWPAEFPPSDIWEFLAYLALAMKKVELTMPTPLPEILDPKIQKELSKKWNRLKQIEQWKEDLGRWQEPDQDTATQAPELRLVLHPNCAVVQVRHPGDAEFGKATQKLLKELNHTPSYGYSSPTPPLSAGSTIVLEAAKTNSYQIKGTEIEVMCDSLNHGLARLITSPELLLLHVASANGEPMQMSDEPLKWELLPPKDASGDYKLRLCTQEGRVPLAPVAILPGSPMHYVTSEVIYPLPYWPFKNERQHWPVTIPAAALETREGVSALGKLGIEPPVRLAGKIQVIKPELAVHCEVHRYQNSPSDYFRLTARAQFKGAEAPVQWDGSRWQQDYRQKISAPTSDTLIQLDKSLLQTVGTWLRQMPLRPTNTSERHVEQRIVGKDWPDIFSAWMERRPAGITVELDAELATLRDGKVIGQARLDIEESKSGVDWFDLQVSLDVTDHTLTPEEIALLLKANGKWVKLAGKGWRKLEFHLTEQQQQDLAELGLSPHEFTGEKQRLHTLQLANVVHGNSGLLPADHAQRVRRRMDEIQTEITPSIPTTIKASLRPYQEQGFHFLAYLSVNRFGGILADDMGLGKTLQALTWIAWLRAEQKVQDPFLVICPKSVQDNWRAEAGRFYPQLRVEVWSRTSAGKVGLDGNADLLVIHYPQLRIHEEALRKVKWGGIILDEAQAIKNPSSQNAKAACALESRHRLALTGTPIENRLLDLWSIFAFAMPGILGSRASFGRMFDAAEDPLARRRLAARTRPFLLRRTKAEVATDLPERVEEDLVIELEGTQATLYQAELKRARAQLLKAETSRELDKMRFNILTSLLRLRQICCHPGLIGLREEKAPAADNADPATNKKRQHKKSAANNEISESAKLTALLEQIEPILDEGQKVLIFSQFVEMLEIIRGETEKQTWKTFILTGSTEDRGALVSEFQNHAGGAVFLISLKAGGSGLNLTAANYVVLFDPWWNPAVEAQAIDRTHRIGQKQTVFAYRLIAKDTIEEKIRLLQKQKGDLAQNILGEESFAQGLTLSDFQFLLGN